MPSSFETDFDAASSDIDALLAESIVHLPAGNANNRQPVSAIVDRDNETSGGVGDGEGADFDREQSVELRRNATLTIDASVTVTESSGTAGSSPSLFEFHGGRWTTVRVLSRQQGKQQVLVTRIDRIATRKVRR